MPSIRILRNTMSDIDEIDFDEIDLMDGDLRHQRADLTTNPDARARSAELQAQRRSDRRKNAVRGARRSSARR